jgi:hypothetical protein
MKRFHFVMISVTVLNSVAIAIAFIALALTSKAKPVEDILFNNIKVKSISFLDDGLKECGKIGFNSSRQDFQGSAFAGLTLQDFERKHTVDVGVSKELGPFLRLSSDQEGKQLLFLVKESHGMFIIDEKLKTTFSIGLDEKTGKFFIFDSQNKLRFDLK